MRELRGIGRTLPLLLGVLLLGTCTVNAFILRPTTSSGIDEDGIVCFKHNETVNVTGMQGTFNRAMTDEDMEPLYMSSLLPDLAFWARMTQQRGRVFKSADIVEQIKRMMWSPYIGVMLVQAGVPYVYKRTNMPDFATLRLKRMAYEFTRLHEMGMEVPNTMFIFNAEDVPICQRVHGCRVPVFSLFKRLLPGEVVDVPTTAATTSTADVTSPAAASALTATSRALLQDNQAKVVAIVGGTGHGSSGGGTGASVQDASGNSRQQGGAVSSEGMSGSRASSGGGGNSGGGGTGGSGSGSHAGSSQQDGQRNAGGGAGRNDMEGSSTGGNRRSLVSVGSTGQQVVAGGQRLAAGAATLAAAGVGAGAKTAVEAGAGAGAASAVGAAATAGAGAKAVPKAGQGTAGAAAGAGIGTVTKEAAGAAGVAAATGLGAAAAGAAAGPAGAAAGGVAVPVMAGGTVITLEPGYGRQDPSQDEDFQDEEILLPNFNQDWGRLCFYPWDKKNHAALMRASLQGTMDTNSTRFILAQMSASSKEAAELLDAGIVWNDSKHVILSATYMRKFLGMKKHSRWRFLLNTDGHTASSRLGHLLGLNSVVLKEKSPWIEYFYRALDPGQDHILFETHSLLPLLKELREPSREAELQRIATRGQQFAYRYLHRTAKALYARQAIIQYNKLFKNIESFVSRLPLTPNTYEGHPPSWQDLLSTLSDITGVPL